MYVSNLYLYLGGLSPIITESKLPGALWLGCNVWVEADPDLRSFWRLVTTKAGLALRPGMEQASGETLVMSLGNTEASQELRRRWMEEHPAGAGARPGPAAGARLPPGSGSSRPLAPESMEKARLTPESTARHPLMPEDRNPSGSLGRPAAGTLAAAASAGTKHDNGKPAIGLICPQFILDVGAAMAYGARKYGVWNYRKGLQKWRLVGAIFRHVLAAAMGEPIDAESGVPHLGMAGANLSMWRDLEMRQCLLEDDTDARAAGT